MIQNCETANQSFSSGVVPVDEPDRDCLAGAVAAGRLDLGTLAQQVVGLAVRPNPIPSPTDPRPAAPQPSRALHQAGRGSGCAASLEGGDRGRVPIGHYGRACLPAPESPQTPTPPPSPGCASSCSAGCSTNSSSVRCPALTPPTSPTQGRVPIHRVRPTQGGVAVDPGPPAVSGTVRLEPFERSPSVLPPG